MNKEGKWQTKRKHIKLSMIDLVVGEGPGTTKISVPKLTGLTLKEAKVIIEDAYLRIGVSIYESNVTDSTSAVIYKQIPPAYKGSELRLGQSVDVFLQIPIQIEEDPDDK